MNRRARRRNIFLILSGAFIAISGTVLLLVPGFQEYKIKNHYDIYISEELNNEKLEYISIGVGMFNYGKIDSNIKNKVTSKIYLSYLNKNYDNVLEDWIPYGSSASLLDYSIETTIRKLNSTTEEDSISFDKERYIDDLNNMKKDISTFEIISIFGIVLIALPIIVILISIMFIISSQKNKQEEQI